MPNSMFRAASCDLISTFCDKVYRIHSLTKNYKHSPPGYHIDDAIIFIEFSGISSDGPYSFFQSLNLTQASKVRWDEAFQGGYLSNWELAGFRRIDFRELNADEAYYLAHFELGQEKQKRQRESLLAHVASSADQEPSEDRGSCEDTGRPSEH
jgi:hypothetical protein